MDDTRAELLPVEQAKNWLVWSNEHRAFWAPNRCGYTGLIEKAGRYTRTEAENICKSANYRANSTIYEGTPPEICMPAPEALETVTRAALIERLAQGKGYGEGDDGQWVGRVPAEPGCEASPSAADGVFAESHPSHGIVERVARGIHAGIEATLPERVRQSWDAITPLTKQAMFARARGAIAAMRDPDPRMIAATLPLISEPSHEQRELGKRALALLPPVRIEQHHKGEIAAAEVVRDWQQMIDAALGE